MIFGIYDTGPELQTPMAMVATEMLNLFSGGAFLTVVPFKTRCPCMVGSEPRKVPLVCARQTSGTLSGTPGEGVLSGGVVPCFNVRWILAALFFLPSSPRKRIDSWGDVLDDWRASSAWKYRASPLVCVWS